MALPSPQERLNNAILSYVEAYKTRYPEKATSLPSSLALHYVEDGYYIKIEGTSDQRDNLTTLLNNFLIQIPSGQSIEGGYLLKTEPKGSAENLSKWGEKATQLNDAARQLAAPKKAEEDFSKKLEVMEPLKATLTSFLRASPQFSHINATVSLNGKNDIEIEFSKHGSLQSIIDAMKISGIVATPKTGGAYNEQYTAVIALSEKPDANGKEKLSNTADEIKAGNQKLVEQIAALRLKAIETKTNQFFKELENLGSGEPEIAKHIRDVVGTKLRQMENTPSATSQQQTPGQTDLKDALATGKMLSGIELGWHV